MTGEESMKRTLVCLLYVALSIVVGCVNPTFNVGPHTHHHYPPNEGETPEVEVVVE